MKRKGYLNTDGWAGVMSHRVWVLGHKNNKYLIKNVGPVNMIINDRRFDVGDQIWVPKRSVALSDWIE